MKLNIKHSVVALTPSGIMVDSKKMLTEKASTCKNGGLCAKHLRKCINSKNSDYFMREFFSFIHTNTFYKDFELNSPN